MDIRNSLNEVMEQISADRDIVSSAKIRAEAEQRSRSAKARPIMAVLCAMALVCGLTASAITLDWTEQLFGTSADIINSNIDRYKVEIGNVKIQNGKNVPYTFTIGDVISDGESLYINILADGMKIDMPDNGFYQFPGTASGREGGQFRTMDWTVLSMEGDTANTAVNINYSQKIQKGDVIEFKLWDNRNIENPGHYNYTSLLASVSFEIQSDVCDIKKVVNVNQTVTFTDRGFYEPGYLEEPLNPSTAELNVDTVSISPLNYVITGTAEGQFNYLSYGNMWFIFKNGEKVCYIPDYSFIEPDEDGTRVTILGNFSERYGAVINPDDIEAVEFDGATVSAQ